MKRFLLSNMVNVTYISINDCDDARTVNLNICQAIPKIIVDELVDRVVAVAAKDICKNNKKANKSNRDIDLYLQETGEISGLGYASDYIDVIEAINYLESRHENVFDLINWEKTIQGLVVCTRGDIKEALGEQSVEKYCIFINQALELFILEFENGEGTPDIILNQNPTRKANINNLNVDYEIDNVIACCDKVFGSDDVDEDVLEIVNSWFHTN